MTRILFLLAAATCFSGAEAEQLGRISWTGTNSYRFELPVTFVNAKQRTVLLFHNDSDGPVDIEVKKHFLRLHSGYGS